MAPNVFICDSMRPRIIAVGKLPSKADRAEPGNRKGHQKIEGRSAENNANRLSTFGKNLDAAGRVAHNPRNSRRYFFCSYDRYRGTAGRKRRSGAASWLVWDRKGRRRGWSDSKRFQPVPGHGEV